MAPDGQNARAINASRLLSNVKNIDLDKIISIGYNTYLSAFDILLPPLIKAFQSGDSMKGLDKDLTEAIYILQKWDRYSSHNSIATTIAVEWGTLLLQKAPSPSSDRESTNTIATFQWLAGNVSYAEKLSLLSQVIKDLESRYGSWKIAWGDINRYQRNIWSLNSNFNDSAWSLPSGLASATWGSLPSFNSRRFPVTKFRYGISGNSFVAAVEFGKKVIAKTIMTGGESFDPASIHFTDQAENFLNGKFKEIHFYKEDVNRNQKSKFHPGEEREGEL
jgi:acyl-homoserine lactone acylase PvdQ